MQPLSETQARFAAAIHDADMEVPDPVTSHATARPPKRFNVYRNNIHASLIGVLEGRFPAVSRLVGTEFFAAMARVYINDHPPRSPILMEYGQTFSEFLESFEPVVDVPYLPDVARIEWAWSFAYYAADAEPVEPETLQALPPETIGDLSFTLHPSLSVVCSRFPAVTIWTANVADEDPPPINAGAGGEDAMILRPYSKVELRHLPVGGAVFIKSLKTGHTLAKASAKVREAASGFDLQANLAGLFSSGAVIAVQH